MLASTLIDSASDEAAAAARLHYLTLALVGVLVLWIWPLERKVRRIEALTSQVWDCVVPSEDDDDEDEDEDRLDLDAGPDEVRVRNAEHSLKIVQLGTHQWALCYVAAPGVESWDGAYLDGEHRPGRVAIRWRRDDARQRVWTRDADELSAPSLYGLGPCLHTLDEALSFREYIRARTPDLKNETAWDAVVLEQLEWSSDYKELYEKWRAEAWDPRTTRSDAAAAAAAAADK